MFKETKEGQTNYCIACEEERKEGYTLPLKDHKCGKISNLKPTKECKCVRMHYSLANKHLGCSCSCHFAEPLDKKNILLTNKNSYVEEKKCEAQKFIDTQVNLMEDKAYMTVKPPFNRLELKPESWETELLNMCQERYSGADCFLVIAKPVEEVIAFIKLQIEKAKAEERERIKVIQDKLDLLETLKKN